MRRRVCLFLIAAGLSVSPLVAQDFAASGDEAISLLQGMVRIDSSSPPGNETEVCEFIQGVLAAEGIESHIYEMEPGRGNLVARIPGNGSKRRSCSWDTSTWSESNEIHGRWTHSPP